jgi:hypothetical protein
MRQPGYVRPLPFDSLDRLLAAAGVDREAWHGVRLVEDRHDQALDDSRTNRHEDQLKLLVEPRP